MKRLLLLSVVICALSSCSNILESDEQELYSESVMSDSYETSSAESRTLLASTIHTNHSDRPSGKQGKENSGGKHGHKGSGKKGH